MKILVVDDDNAILEAVKDLLEFEGCQVQTTGNGEETYTIARDFHPDVILLDLFLSGTDGSEICEKLKKDSHLKDIPVIIMSAHPTAPSYARRAGADCFMPKPFEANHLLKTVKHIS